MDNNPKKLNGPSKYFDIVKVRDSGFTESGEETEERVRDNESLRDNGYSR